MLDNNASTDAAGEHEVLGSLRLLLPPPLWDLVSTSFMLSCVMSPTERERERDSDAPSDADAPADSDASVCVRFPGLQVWSVCVVLFFFVSLLLVC